MVCMYIYNGILLYHKKECNLTYEWNHNDCWHFLTGLFHLAWCSYGPSMSLQMAVFYPFLGLSSIPLYIWTTSSNKQKLIDTGNSIVVARKRRLGSSEGLRGPNIWWRRTIWLWWGLHNVTYRSGIIEPYTWNTHNLVNQCHPIHIIFFKKNEILSFATAWIDLEGIILSEISQSEKDKCHMISLICGI